MIMEKMLEKFGLSDKEAKMYLASLELGYATMQQIAQKADINRTTGYVILDSLVAKGLMTHFTKGKKRYFAAEPPEQVLSVLEKEKENLEEKKSEFERVLPELKSIYNLAETKPKVKFYEGKEGVKAIQEDFLNTKGDQAYSFVSLDEMFQTLPDYEERYTAKRIARKVKIRTIYTRANGPVENATSEKNLREARFIPKEKFPFSCSVNIFGDKVSLATYKGNIFGVTIESRMIADSFRAIFELAWEAAEKYQR